MIHGAPTSTQRKHEAHGAIERGANWMKRNAVNPRNVRLFYGFNFAFDVGPLVKREEQTLADWMSPLNQISRLHFVPRRSGRPVTFG